MNVDEFKQKYGERSLSKFWEVSAITHTPVIPIKLYEILESTIKKLDQIYIPNALLWVRLENKSTWQELIEIEKTINTAIQGKNEEYLKEALEKYYEMWVIIIEAFRLIKDEFIPF